MLGLFWIAGAADVETGQQGEAAVLGSSGRSPRLPGEGQVPAAGPGDATPTVRFRLPFRTGVWRATTGYVDLNPASPDVEDYECHQVTYDGHLGNDNGILDFVAMDEGRWVLAAADGVVLDTYDGSFDRRAALDPTDPANGVRVTHDDGTISTYLHFKKWSVVVAPGQRVREGQPIGLIGSSGYTDGPHLHFETRNDGVVYAPGAGACRLGDSLWKAQESHAFDRPFEYIHTRISSVPWTVARFYETPPNVHHMYQGVFPVSFVRIRFRYGHPGDTIGVVYRNPAGAVHYSDSATLSTFYGYGYASWNTPLPGSGSLGTWSVETLFNGQIVDTTQFVYDQVPFANPVGQSRTVTVNHGRASGDLRGTDADSGVYAFRVVTPPTNGWVWLSGARAGRFSYVPHSGFAGTDSFTYEVEDSDRRVSAPAIITLDVLPATANTIRLEGEDGHVAVPDDGSLDLDSEFTLEAWIRRITGSSDREVLVERRNSTSETGYSLSTLDNGKLRLTVGDGSVATILDGNTPIPMYRWTHVAGTWDGGFLRLYVDGALDAGPLAFSGPISYPGTYDTWLGRGVTDGASFRGEIDELRIWSVARTASELLDGASCSLLTGTPPPELRGRWAFTGNADDSSSFANHGTLVEPGSFRLVEGELSTRCSGVDTDGDGLNDDLDNCSLNANAGQGNGDGDGFGDACDLCPSIFETSVHDSDDDGIADTCDLCPFTPDSEQLDTDSDGAGDLCDPDPQSAVVGVPSDDIVLSLAHNSGTDVTTVDWTPEALSATYEVYRGSLAEVREGFYGNCQNSRDGDTTDTTFAEDERPAAGEAYYFLVVGVGADGTRGLAGLDSFARQRDLRAKDCPA
jgi:murein DD-endopeptidase MepM/ murein hydrolase activator NlpD